MVEVFKTNVEQQEHAEMLLAELHKYFTGSNITFDLDDCDKILRVESKTGTIQPGAFISLLNNFGFCAETLPDHFEQVAMLTDIKEALVK